VIPGTNLSSNWMQGVVKIFIISVQIKSVSKLVLQWLEKLGTKSSPYSIVQNWSYQSISIKHSKEHQEHLQKSKLYLIHEQYFSWPQCVHERHFMCTNNSVQGLLTEPI
jgi:hypothetical protein